MCSWQKQLSNFNIEAENIFQDFGENYVASLYLVYITVDKILTLTNSLALSSNKVREVNTKLTIPFQVKKVSFCGVFLVCSLPMVG